MKRLLIGVGIVVLVVLVALGGYLVSNEVVEGASSSPAASPAVHRFASEVRHLQGETVLDRFKLFISDSEGSTFYSKWAAQNKGELARWTTYRDALVAGGDPAAPTMATLYGAALVDAGVLYRDAVAAIPPPATTTTTAATTTIAATTTTTASTTTVAPPPTTTTTAAASPSGESMPTGDIAGWHQIFTDDFTTNVPLGSFPSAVSSKWTGYPWPWTGTPTWANYYPEKVVSQHDGMLDIWLHDELIGGVRKYLIAALEPKVNGPNSNLYLGAGRYVVRFKADKFAQYHMSFLLWPQADDDHTNPWPGSGEIDWPEGDYSGGSAYAFMHRQSATTGGDQDAFNSGVSLGGSGWHTAIIEWKAGTYCRFILDGRTVGSVTSRVPTSAMRWVLQDGGTFGITPTAGPNGHIDVDWVVVYTPA